MPFERLRKILGKERILNWNHDQHPGMIWRYPDPSSENEMERETGKIDAFQVKIGERAIALMNNEFYEDTPPAIYWLKGEQKKGLEVIFIDQGQVKQRWGIPGTILTKDEQELGAHGDYMFRITDPKSFVLSIVSAQRAYTAEQINDFIRGYVSDVLRQHLTNYTVLDGQIRREREEFVRAVKAKCQELFTRWGLELINMEVQVNIPEELEETIKKRAEIERYKLTKTIEQQRLEADNSYELLRINLDKMMRIEGYKSQIEIEQTKRQSAVLAKQTEQILKSMDVEVEKLQEDLAKIATDMKAYDTERLAQAGAVATELAKRAEIAGDILKKTTDTELKIKEMEADQKGKTSLASIEASKEVEKARAEAQARIMQEENRLKTLKEIQGVLADMAEAVAVGGAEHEAMRKGLEEKFVTLLHQIGVDVPEYEKAKHLGKLPPTEIKIEQTVAKGQEKTKTCSCGRELKKDARYCDSCGKEQ
jgi:hypothetical protein